MNQTDQKLARKNRLIMLLLLAIFLAPALGSWLLYENVDRLHLGTTNRGEFVQPPRPVDPAGLGLPQGYLTHHFTLIYVGAGPACAAACSQALQVMQATRLSLGEQTHDVQQLYLPAGTPDPKLVRQDAALTAADVAGKPALKAFDGADSPKYIYLVNPQGFVVLRYPLAEDPKWLLQDLRHLLGAGEG